MTIYSGNNCSKYAVLDISCVIIVWVLTQSHKPEFLKYE